MYLDIVGEFSLKIWANCANSDTSMKISDKHNYSISFTYGLLAIIFFHFFKMATAFFKMAIFSFGIYFLMKYVLRNTVY